MDQEPDKHLANCATALTWAVSAFSTKASLLDAHLDCNTTDSCIRKWFVWIDLVFLRIAPVIAAEQQMNAA